MNRRVFLKAVPFLASLPFVGRYVDNFAGYGLGPGWEINSDINDEPTTYIVEGRTKAGEWVREEVVLTGGDSEVLNHSYVFVSVKSVENTSNVITVRSVR